jgi:hypothetical protein
LKVGTGFAFELRRVKRFEGGKVGTGFAFELRRVKRWKV